MRRLNIELLKGNERLAKPIKTETDITLLSTGLQIKKNYIPKLRELGIEYIYVEDELSKGVDIHDIIQEETRDKSKVEVKRILEKFSAHNKLEMDKLTKTADNIVEEVLDQKEVLINLTDIRRKDEYIYGHSVSVCALSVLLALKLGFNKKRVKDIAIGALLHDLGKVLIPNELLAKQEPYNEKEEEEFKKHVIYGFEAVKEENWLSPVSKVIILMHHENVDGSGYPFGWKGEKIHDASKLVSICNEFDRLTMNNIKEKCYKIYEAIEYLTNQSDRLFDGKILKYFINNIAVYPSGTGVLTNNDKKAIVLRQNKEFPARPVIRIIEDSKGNKVNEWKELNLKYELTTFIVDTFEV